MASHDQALAFALAISTFQFAPFLVLLYPILSFAIRACFGTRLSITQKDTLRSEVEIPYNALLRLTIKKESHVFSIPGASIVYVNSSLLRNLKNPINKGILLHELGHHAGNDATVLLWLRTALTVWLLLVPIWLAYVWITIFKIEVEGVMPLLTFGPAATLTALSSVCVPILILLTHHRYVHRREFLADCVAKNINHDAVSNFLNYGAWKQRSQKPKLWYKNLFPNHPSFKSRIASLESEHSLTFVDVFYFTAFWTLLAFLIVIFSQFGAFELIFSREILIRFRDPAVLFLTFFLIAATGYWTLLFNQIVARWAPFAAITGYALAATFGLLAVAITKQMAGHSPFSVNQLIQLVLVLIVFWTVCMCIGISLATRTNLHPLSGAAISLIAALGALSTFSMLAGPIMRGSNTLPPLTGSIAIILASLTVTVFTLLVVVLLIWIARTFLQRLLR